MVLANAIQDAGSAWFCIIFYALLIWGAIKLWGKLPGSVKDATKRGGESLAIRIIKQWLK